MTKIITANFLIWKSMDLHTDSRTKRPNKYVSKQELKHENKCPVCRDKCKIYNPRLDTYIKCRRCEGCTINVVSKDYDWLD
jgi:hypothetical protein